MIFDIKFYHFILLIQVVHICTYKQLGEDIKYFYIYHTMHSLFVTTLFDAIKRRHTCIYCRWTDYFYVCTYNEKDNVTPVLILKLQTVK